MIIFISIVLIISLLYAWHLRSKRIKAKGAIQDFWDKFSVAIFTISSLLIVTYFGVPEQEFQTAFGQIGEFIRMIDGAIGIASLLILSFKKWVGTACVLVMLSIQLDAQTQWIQAIDGKYYQVEIKTDGPDEYTQIYELWAEDYTRRNQGFSAKTFDPLKVGKSVIDFVRKHRFSQKERAIYNIGVRRANELLEFEVFETID